MEIDWVKIAAIVGISGLAALLIVYGKPELGANLGIAILAYLFGNYQGKRAAAK